MLNLTLIVQMVHFGIAYVLLDRIFLRKVFHLLQAEDVQAAHVERSVADLSKTVEQIATHNSAVWHELQQTLLKKAPAAEPLVFARLQTDDLDGVPPLSKQAFAALVADVQRTIVNQVIRS